MKQVKLIQFMALRSHLEGSAGPYFTSVDASDAKDYNLDDWWILPQIHEVTIEYTEQERLAAIKSNENDESAHEKL